MSDFDSIVFLLAFAIVFWMGYFAGRFKESGK